MGAPFMVMERRHGVVVRQGMPPVFAGQPDAPRQMSEALVDTLAEFHAVDYEAVGLSDLGHPAGFVSRQIEGWYQRWQAAKTENVPAMDSVYDWLTANQPESRSFSLVHNDYKLDNAMLAVDDPGHIGKDAALP